MMRGDAAPAAAAQLAATQNDALPCYKYAILFDFDVIRGLIDKYFEFCLNFRRGLE